MTVWTTVHRARRFAGLWAALVLAVILLFGAVGCGDRKQLVTLTILGEDTGTMQAIDSVRSEFEATHGVKINCVKNTFEVLQQKSNEDLSRGTGLYDIILNYNFSLSTFVRSHWVLNLKETQALLPPGVNRDFEKDIFANIWREVGYYPIEPGAESEAIGYPFAGNTMLLVYNKRLLTDAANQIAYRKQYNDGLVPPKTWNQFLHVAEFFTRRKDNLYGVVLQGASGGWLYYEWCNFAYGMGGGTLRKSFGWEGDVSTPVIIDSPATVAATKFYVALKPFTVGDFMSTGQNEQQVLMQKGNVAMAIMWSDVLHGLIAAPGGSDFGFASIPGEQSQIGGGVFYINRDSKQQKLAAEFIVFLLQKRTQVKMMHLGLCSPLRSTYEDPSIKDIPYAQALSEALPRGTYMAEAGPDADAIQEIVTRAVQQIWTGRASAEDALGSARQELDKKRTEIFKILAK